MDYEKAYKEALNWMRGIYPTLTGSDKEDAEHYFPELRESERAIEILEDYLKWAVSSEEECRYTWKELANAIQLAVDTMKEQKPEQYDIDVLEKHITKDSISELAHTVIVRNGWEIVEKEQKPVERWQYVGKVDLEENKKEENSNIELIQKSWYMEGYNDRKFNKEPKWIIKTGEGGPRYEENPKYGQHIEDKPDTRDSDDLQLLGFIHDLLNEIEWKDDWAMSKEECLRLLSNYCPQKSAVWSEEDEKRIQRICGFLWKNRKGDTDTIYQIEKDADWLKNLPERFVLQPKQEWSEEDEEMLNSTL